MNNLKKISICVCLMCFISVLTAQENINGVGIILPELIYFESQTRSAEIVEFDLYDTAFVSTGDCLYSNKMDGLSQLILSSGELSGVKHENAGLVWVGYKSHALQFYEASDGFLSVYLDGRKYWIKKEQLHKYGFEYILWRDYYKGLKNEQLECIYNMNIRAEASTQSQKVALISKNIGNKQYHLMELTGRFEGLWAEVNVRIWDSMEDACSAKREPTRRITGWIKYLDDGGFPNIFNIPTPCC